jgi:hypothetical protein
MIQPMQIITIGIGGGLFAFLAAFLVVTMRALQPPT